MSSRKSYDSNFLWRHSTNLEFSAKITLDFFITQNKTFPFVSMSHCSPLYRITRINCKRHEKTLLMSTSIFFSLSLNAYSRLFLVPVFGINLLFPKINAINIHFDVFPFPRVYIWVIVCARWNHRRFETFPEQNSTIETLSIKLFITFHRRTSKISFMFVFFVWNVSKWDHSANYRFGKQRKCNQMTINSEKKLNQ